MFRQIAFTLAAAAVVVGCGPPFPVSQTKSTVAAVAPADPFAGLELKRINDANLKLKELPGTADVETRAKLIAEIDAWIFAAEDEQAAKQLIAAELQTLRKLIEAQVSAQLRAALEAENGKSADLRLSQVRSLVQLYPVPQTGNERIKLEEMTSKIVDTSRRVDAVRRLRYNKWAIDQVERALQKYHEHKSFFGKNKDILILEFSEPLKVVDPIYLEPAAMELYQYAYGLVREAVDEPGRIALAKALANPAASRKPLADF